MGSPLQVSSKLDSLAYIISPLLPESLERLLARRTARR